MNNIINLANCANPDSVFNVGIPPCDLAKKKIKGVILADSGVTFTGADVASVPAFIAAVKTKSAAARGGRVYPIWDILNFEDNTGEPSTGQIGNLTTATIITQDAVPAFGFGYQGSEARHKTLSAMIGSSLTVFFVDEQYAVYGTDRNGAFGGFKVLQAYSYSSKFIVSDAVNQYRFRLTLGSIAEYREQSRYIVANSGLLSAQGLVNVNLAVQSQAANVIKVAAIADGGTDLEPLYGAQIAAMAWTAKNLQTGVAVTVSSVAKDDANSAFTVTLDNVAWGAAASGDKFQINGPASDILNNGGVKPYECVSVVVTKP